MFSGIVEGVGRVVALDRSDGGGSLTVAAPRLLDAVRVGESIAVNGTCLTVAGIDDGQRVTFDLMPETLRRTNLSRLTIDDRVNLEQSLRLGDRLGGHFVQGHVDGLAEIVSIIADGDARLVRFRLLDARLGRYVVEKGFVAVDGVSLTIVAPTPDGFTVSLVRTTLEITILGTASEGALVNIEVDLFARYLLDRPGTSAAPRVAPVAGAH